MNEKKAHLLTAAAHLLESASHQVMVPGSESEQIDELIAEALALVAESHTVSS